MSPEKSIPVSTYREHIQRARSQGDWFMVPRSYAKAFGRDIAMFLADLLNFGQMRSDENGWFHCSTQDMVNSLNWHRNVQIRYLKILEKKNFLKRDTIGLGRKRVFWLDIVRIENEVSKRSSGDRSTPYGVDTPAPYGVDVSKEKKEIREVGMLPHAQNANKGAVMDGVFFDHLVESPKNYKGYKFDHLMSNLLRTATIKLGFTNVKRNNPKKWENEFKLMRTKDGHSVQEIDDLVEWYVANCKDVPKLKVQHAKQFRKCWQWLSDLRAKDLKWDKVTDVSAIDLYNNLKGLGWRGESRDQLLALVSKTLAAFTKLFRQFREADTPLANHLRGTMYDPASATKRWYEAVHARLSTWDKWDGNLSPFAWDGDLSNKAFNAYMCKMTSDYARNTQPWFELKERLK